MNYIKQLQVEVAENKLNKEEITERINCFLKYLNSPKFQGVENNYINAQEVYNFLVELRMIIM